MPTVWTAATGQLASCSARVFRGVGAPRHGENTHTPGTATRWGARRHWSVLRLLCGTAAVVLSGCTAARSLTRPSWIADYDKAERQHRAADGTLLIWYQEARPGYADSLQKAFDTPELRRRLKGYVRCSLLRSYEPDRRYVAQYEVERAPALIVVHADGTYHARSGRMTAEDIARLLEEAQPPGATPRLNPHLHHAPHYDWLDHVDAASAVTERENKAMVVVLYRAWSRDWHRLEQLFERREVYRRFAGMVPCRVSSLSSTMEALLERFGVARLPAIVIVQRDGAHHALELPTSAEAVVRFADRAGGIGGSSPPGTETAGR